jgi:hypothetical protein
MGYDIKTEKETKFTQQRKRTQFFLAKEKNLPLYKIAIPPFEKHRFISIVLSPLRIAYLLNKSILKPNFSLNKNSFLFKR